MKPTILFSTPFLQHPPVTGPTLRIENSIKALAQIAHLHIHSRVRLKTPGQVSALSYYRRYSERLYLAPSSGWVARLRAPKALATGAVNYLARRIIAQNLFVSRHSLLEQDCADLLRIAARVNADLIWLGFGCVSYPLLRLIKASGTYKIVVDTDSVHSRLILRGLPYAQNEQARSLIAEAGRVQEEAERWGTPLADVTTAVSEIDAAYYREFAPPGAVHRFSNVIDLEMYRAVPAPAAGLQRPCIHLAGTFWPGGCPMEDAARWFVRDVLPLVRNQIPDVHLYIVGYGSDRVMADAAGPGITVTGTLPSVLPYLCHADVAVVPLRFESGTRFKILEAGACGIPVVSTTLGAEGLPVQHGVHVLVADSREDFAAAVVRLITDRELAGRLASHLKALTSARFTISVLAEEGRSILRYLLVYR